MWYEGKHICYPQTTSAACVHHAHSWKQASFDSGAKHDGQCYLSQEGCACGAHVISAMLVPPEEAPSEQDEGAQVPRE